MDFQTQILQNDVEHLEKNMKTVFQQLMVLQKFIKQEYGSKFEEFCFYQRPADQEPEFQTSPQPPDNANTSTRLSVAVNRNSRLPQQSPASIRPRPNTRSQQTNQDQELSNSLNSTRSQSIPAATSEPQMRITRCGGDNFAAIPDSDCTASQDAANVQIKSETLEEFCLEESSNGSANYYMDCNDDEENVFDLSDDDENDNNEDLSKDPNFSIQETVVGTLASQKKETDDVWTHFEKAAACKMRCRQCGYLVSGRRHRLKGHLSKCKDSPQPHCMLNTAVEVEKVKNRNVRGGRARDEIRRFFTLVVDAKSGYKRSQCLKCGLPVSDKAYRLKQHYATCQSSTPTPTGSENASASLGKVNVDDISVPVAAHQAQSSTEQYQEQSHSSSLENFVSSEENIQVGQTNSTQEVLDAVFSNPSVS